MRILIGIDCGLNGAVAIVGDSVLMFSTPTVTVTKGKGEKHEYDVAAMRVILDGYPDAHVILERAQAFPKQGAVSNFSTGHGYGLWRGLIVGLGMSYETVAPLTWKRAMGLDSDKAKSILMAKQLFPQTEGEYRLPRGRKDTLDGKAEALLLTEWARRRGVAEAV